MLKKILILYGLILILMFTVQTTTQNNLFFQQLKAQNYADEGDPGSWSPCPLCHCGFSASGDCCCGGVDIYAPMPCLCNACLQSYDCDKGHTCPNLQTSEDSVPSDPIGGGGGGSYYTPTSPTMSYTDWLDYINNHYSIYNVPPYTPPGGTIYTVSAPTTLMQAATRVIMRSSKIHLALGHVSGVIDNANANQNVIDASKGLQASRSNYENAPGGTTPLSYNLLGGIKSLSDSGYTFSISEIAGGSHTGTHHYDGNCTDINIVNGHHVDVQSMTSLEVKAFREAAKSVGAKVVYDPYYDPYGGHSNHFHIEW